MSSTPDLTADGRTLAVLAAQTADDKQGADTVVLHVGDVLSITELFVVTSASNSRLVRSIADHIEQRAKEELGRSPIRTEGAREQQWVLIDYGDVVVHVFAEEQRRFYEIERLYRDVPRIPWSAGTEQVQDSEQAEDSEQADDAE